jgi:hypothetical protein
MLESGAITRAGSPAPGAATPNPGRVATTNGFDDNTTTHDDTEDKRQSQ